MKKLFACLLALLLLAASALAEGSVDVIKLERSIDLCKATNCYVARTADGYQLFTADGQAISAAYRSMTVKQNGDYLEVQNVSASEQLNCLGLLNAAGQEILPMAYGDFYYDYDNPDWVLAYVLAPSEGDVGEYKDGQGNQYIISRTDVVYKGKIIGSMGREDYTKAATVGSRGSFLYVRPNKEQIFWLDENFNRVDVTGDISISEYTSIYKKGVWHNPTQQYAFTPGCPLTAEQVDQHIWYDSYTGNLLDLQGNVIASGLLWDYAYFEQNYFIIKHNGLCGIIDLQGNVIVPLAYADIASSDEGLFVSGYTALVDDKGRLSYVNEQGEITASVEYELSYSDYKGFTYNAPIVAVKNMGKYMLISATHGQLDGMYDDVQTSKGGHDLIAVQKGEVWGCIGLDGSIVVPFELRYAPTISDDGSLVTGTNTDRESILYRLGGAADPTAAWTDTKVSGEETDDAPVLADGAWECTCGVITTGKFCPECGTKKPEPTPTPEPTATPEPTPAPAADDGSWTCSCGVTTNGKFCPECGSKKPEATEAPAVDDGTWTCACGAVNVGKFCAECGTKKPEATPVPTPTPEPQCVSCGYKPEGAVPKFCPECGTKF